MRPLDPRLLRYAAAARTFLGVGVALGIVRTAATLAFCWLLAQAIVGAIAGRSLGELLPGILSLAVVGVLRAGTMWAMDAAAARGAATVKSQLRRRLVAGITRLGPGWLGTRNRVDVVTTAGPALDALDGYFSLFLPQIVLTAIATPLVIVAIFLQDVLSGILVVVALPLIPVFMVLIGLATQAVQRRQWLVLARLSSRFLDVVGGLATLKIFGRQHRQAARIATLTEDYRVETMKVLRLSFLSGFALELIGSLSVALVAVSVGLRLVDGSLALSVGLFVLLLAPEAFLPLRQVGANYHAAADGVAAAEDVFDILDAAAAMTAEAPAIHSGTVSLVRRDLRFAEVSVRYEGRTAIDRFSAVIRPGRMTVLAGPSGSGKSTLLAALLGFVPFDGEIEIGDATLATDRRSLTAWAGQGAPLLEGTISSNVSLGDSAPDLRLVRRALTLAALSELDPGTVVTVTGGGLSGGQGERVVAARAMYRALARHCPVVAFDEPSAALDPRAEAALLEGLRQLADEGYTVLVVSHRPAVIAAADDLIELGVVHV
ncbi:thiol reductant ABC exporter subunit CydD [Glaciihabitans sp. INWT7]|uniref:thiol reductant ABC exporter subunit CydD n=1 Tax=Glaciihabitans sp. INWT7 TaxID=2596912 RepID=UPI0016283BF6|nr:thiol reductant ABC exporter subunit CydD [Glaciihabitans sp. INWT7]QNE46722.1 thiol reductant ABC exporter subunit CydD [Glaciihabitans sp. INWT7]